jgi:hypothetical protein
MLMLFCFRDYEMGFGFHETIISGLNDRCAKRETRNVSYFVLIIAYSVNNLCELLRSLCLCGYITFFCVSRFASRLQDERLVITYSASYGICRF